MGAKAPNRRTPESPKPPASPAPLPPRVDLAADPLAVFRPPPSAAPVRLMFTWVDGGLRVDPPGLVIPDDAFLSRSEIGPVVIDPTAVRAVPRTSLRAV